MSPAKRSVIKHASLVAAVFILFKQPAKAADNLKLNPHLDYQSDSLDGPLITGDNLSSGIVSDKPNYVIIYAEGCYNSKRQAKRTVSLYSRYRDRVNFVVIDLDQHPPAGQGTLLRDFYKGSIPTVVILGNNGTALYSQAGEKDEGALGAILDRALR